MDIKEETGEGLKYWSYACMMFGVILLIGTGLWGFL